MQKVSIIDCYGLFIGLRVDFGIFDKLFLYLYGVNMSVVVSCYKKCEDTGTRANIEYLSMKLEIGDEIVQKDSIAIVTIPLTRLIDNHPTPLFAIILPKKRAAMIIIPARIASTRFPRKVLHEIDGVAMVIHTARRAKEVDDVVIATDSQEVAEVAKRYGFEAVMTSQHHASGTDRINEAATILGLDKEEIILNIQADEPFIEPEVIATLQDLTAMHAQNENVMMCTLCKSEPFSDGNDPNKVKVVIDAAGYALYFSRSLIPYPRSPIESVNIHLGVYGYSRKMLERFCALAQAPLESIEKLEQLRALYHGYKIALRQVESKSVGIDTPEDLQKL